MTRLDPDIRLLWLSMIGGPIVYSLHFLSSYLLVEGVCKLANPQSALLGRDGLVITILVLTVVAAAITLWMGLWTYRRWQQQHGDDGQLTEEVVPFLALVGTWLNGLSTLLILATGLPALVLLPCAWS
jgi:uncharacterized membrane-anchored protein